MDGFIINGKIIHSAHREANPNIGEGTYTIGSNAQCALCGDSMMNRYIVHNGIAIPKNAAKVIHDKIAYNPVIIKVGMNGKKGYAHFAHATVATGAGLFAEDLLYQVYAFAEEYPENESCMVCGINIMRPVGIYSSGLDQYYVAPCDD